MINNVKNNFNMTRTFTFFFPKKPFWVYVIAFFSVFQTVAQAPTVQASDIVFTNTKKTTTTINWKRGNGSHRIVFMRKGTSTSPYAMPEDYSAYFSDSVFGQGSQIGTSGWYCVGAIAGGNMVDVTGLNPETLYQVQVLEYNYVNNTWIYLRSTNTGNPAEITTPGHSDTLSNLSLSAGALSTVFSPEMTDYTAKVAHDLSSIKITPTTTDTDATVKVNGTAVVSGSSSQEINLAVGVSTAVTIEVTAKNGMVKTYTINVFRPHPSPTIQATGLTFTNTTATGTTVHWTNGNGSNRMVLMRTGTADIPVLPNSYFLSSTVFGMGDQIGASGWYVIAYSNNPGNEVEIKGLDLKEIYQVMVVELNGDSPSFPTYLTTTGTNNPATVTTLSNVATLSNLSLSAGALSTAFSSATTAYTAKVAADVNSITVTPVTSDANATVKVNGTVVVSGNASPEINLAAGASTAVTIEVTAQDGTAKTYKLTVEKNSLGVVNTEIEGFVVYPNPVPHGRLYIQTRSAVVMEVELFDLSGKKVFSVQTTNKEVPIEGLQKGVYILKVRQDGAVSTEKIMVQ
ncbi:cadherin-like beta sandwich domain-containing protein [Flavobacterium sp. T12S277]|uniref:cadherin-like beta sandwich domain-containing protein n=1 Tax=Flavobacterium sp. T12S277 TaxID=3402752 RepID=UPI003AE20CB9